MDKNANQCFNSEDSVEIGNDELMSIIIMKIADSEE